MEKITLAAPDADLDLEKAIPISEQGPSSPNSQTTWASKSETLKSQSIAPRRLEIEEDSEEESSKSNPVQGECRLLFAVHQPQSITLAERICRALFPKAFSDPARKPFKTIVRKCKLASVHLQTSVLTESVEQCDQGYPYLASFLDSDENFMIYRRFGFIHARLLLQKQDELRIMEAELDRMDKRDRFNNVEALQCRMTDESRTQDGESRKALLSRLQETVLVYDELLLKAQQLAASNRPPQRDYNSVANFVRHKKPLVEGDDDFIYRKEDLITLRPGRESAWLDAAVEKLLKLKVFPRNAVKYIFCSKVIFFSNTLE